MDQKIIYGGQAVIEGVMIRGMHIVSVAVRNPKGTISTHTVPVNSWFNSFIRKIPFVRGILVMAETLAIGMRALTYSANIAAGEDEEFGKGSKAVMLILSLAFAIGFFFLLPVFASKGFESLVDSNLLANILVIEEGASFNGLCKMDSNDSNKSTSSNKKVANLNKGSKN